MKTKILLLCGAIGMGMISTSYAGTTTGTINAELVLTTGCLVNGQPGTSSVNFGTLNFGTSPATFTTLTATLVGTAGNGIYVKCSAGSTYNVQITGSDSAPATVYGTVSSQPRYLINATTPSIAVAYTLYPSTAYSTPIANNTNLTANGTTDATLGQNYEIFGQIAGGGDNPSIPAGTYADTINVAVNY